MVVPSDENFVPLHNMIEARKASEHTWKRQSMRGGLAL
jgi:hypothetical protein